MKRSIVLLLHIGYWILYGLLAVSFLLVVSKNAQTSGLGIWELVYRSPMALVIILPAVLGFYSFYYIVFPRWLDRHQLVLFFAGAFVIAFCCGLIPVLLLSIPNRLWKISNSLTDKFNMSLVMGLLAGINGVIAGVIRGFIKWYSDLKWKEDLNRKNFETELALLKSTLNPHFLFNTINNIDILIEKDPARASRYLNQLSVLLRFMLYETGTEKIALSKELAFIEKYLELQQIRTANAEFIRYELDGLPEDIMIPPMLFIPFLENAFKHAEKFKHEHALMIRLGITPKVLSFHCSNKYGSEQLNEKGIGGLGNGLQEKRLQMLYPEKHQLTITDSDGRYTVDLILELDDQH